MSDLKDKRCPYSSRCGSCNIGEIGYEEGLKEKKKWIGMNIGEYCKVNDIAGMYYPFHYRNKVHAVFGRINQQVVAGNYLPGTHDIIPITDCLIEDAQASAIISTVVDLIKSFKYWIYDEDSGRGFMRHILIRKGASTKQIMVVLVTAQPQFPHKNNFVAKLRQIHPEITTIVQNINDQQTSMVLGERSIPLYGTGYIEDVLMGLSFRISPSSFYQINSQQTQVLYKKVIAAAALTGNETVIDTYCGIGTIGMVLAKAMTSAKTNREGRVIGVELNKEAVKDARANAKRNNIQNIQFVAADATEYMLDMANDGARADVVILDPPRSGCTNEFVQATASISPNRIVYVSCNPETLGRDLGWFKSAGYKAKEAWPVDMFCFTQHCECVVLLERK